MLNTQLSLSLEIAERKFRILSIIDHNKTNLITWIYFAIALCTYICNLGYNGKNKIHKLRIEFEIQLKTIKLNT